MKLEINEKVNNSNWEVVGITFRKAKVYNDKGAYKWAMFKYYLLLNNKGQERILRADKKNVSEAERYYCWKSFKYKKHNML